MYIYTQKYIYIDIYIYIYRDRYIYIEIYIIYRENERYIYIYIYIYVLFNTFGMLSSCSSNSRPTHPPESAALAIRVACA